MSTTTALDLNSRYSVAGYSGIAFAVIGYATEERETLTWYCHDDDCEHDWSCADLEIELVERDDMVRAVMVGDDRVQLVDVDDLTPIADDDYCSGCGQIGCGWH